MEGLSATENLFEKWMLFSAKNDREKLADFVNCFQETYKHLVDLELTHLNDGYSEEGPHFTVLPNGVLQVFSTQLYQCSESIAQSCDLDTLHFASSIMECLIIITRNYDNVPLVASCEFVKYIVSIASIVISKIKDKSCDINDICMFVKLVIHFFECLYDPYFIWRKRIKGWSMDKNRMKYKPANLHVEVVPFFFDCFDRGHLPFDLRIRLLHMFGAIMCGSQNNALKVITPATLEVLLKMLSADHVTGPTNELRQELFCIKDLVLKCIICMVHVINLASIDQRQVEVSHVMEDYIKILLKKEDEPQDEQETHIQLAMIGAINEMLSCQDKSSLQVIMVSGGTFDAFISLLQKTALTGSEGQTLAMSVLGVMNSVLSGSVSAKERFHLRVGYVKFVEALKSLGQPSIDLLKAVLNLVVETEFDGTKHLVVHNTQAAIMLLHWLPDIQSHDLQMWLSECLGTLCAKSYNKMNCCRDGMIGAILQVLERLKQINTKAVGYLISLLECLGTQSITATELKKLISLLRLDEEENQNPYCSRLMRAMSTMARREGNEGALHFLSLQEHNDCVTLPAGIKKWPGVAFSFHAWLCLDTEVDLTTHNIAGITYRRQLYSFIASTGCGLESFVTAEFDIVISVFNKKEHSSVLVANTTIGDGHWHCIDIVQSSSRRPFTVSQLNVYFDGKLVHNSQLKFPSMTDPFSSCYIGSPCPKSALAAIADQIDSNTNAEVKKKSPFKFIFPGQSKPSTEPGVKTVATGTQNEEWGSPIVLHGQIGSVCLFHDVITPSQIKTLYTLGPNKMNIFDDDDHTELNDLVNKSVLYYSAKAHKDGVVVDLTGNQHHGHLIGQCCVTWDIKDVINCIGGIQVLFPLLEQVNKSPIPENDEVTTLSNPVTISPTDDDWLVIRPSSSYADSKLEQNQAAGFLTLLRHMLHTSSTNRDTFTRINAAATIGAILQKVNCKLIDVHVLMSVQLLVDMATTTSRTLLQHLYQYILFDFRIWSKSHFPIRIGHIQYLSTIIKDDKKYFRKKFGVQFILDVIRMYYSSVRDSGLSSEDSKQIRVSLFSLVKFYIAREVTADELLHIIGFLVVAREENMICEILDVLISLLENPRKQDQLFLLLFEADMGEMLYGLLVHQGYSVVFYEKIVKVLYLLLKSDKVYEKSKTRLRLAECGHLGIVGLMQGIDISGPMIKRFLEQVTFNDTSQNYNSVLAILQLIHTCGSDIKLEATKQIISLLVSRPNAAKSFAKQLGWQESLVKLFIFRTFDDLPVNKSDHQLSSNLISEVTKGEITSDSTAFCSTVESDDVDNSQCDVSTICDNHKPGKHPDNLNLFLVCDNVSLPSPKTPGTPMFLNHIDDFNSSSEDLRLRSMSRSSTASLEDLSSSRRSQDRDSRISGFSINGPVDMNASISSFSDSRRSSGNLENEDLQQALDKLGIQSYLKDSGERLEEVCQNVIVILLMIMTKGVEGSNTDAWKERIQVFTWIDRIAEDNELIRPAIELKRRLFEMLVEANATEIRESGQALAGPSENARELIKFVRYFMLTEPSDDKFSVTLIEDVMSLMDNLAVWDVESDGGWKEMARLGLNLLILYGQFPDVELCAVAAAKLHMLVQTKLISSSAEASYLIGNLNSTIQQAVKEKTDNYSFLITVMKALIEKAHTLLSLDMQLPNLPTLSRSPSFFDDFKSYCFSEEWKIFMENYVTPQMEHFTESAFNEVDQDTKLFWSDCKNLMMENFHKRNREQGESKLKFQSQIFDVYKNKAINEERRFQNVAIHMKNQYSSTVRQWRASKRFFTGETGAWAERSQGALQWKMSNQENFSRMRVKLIPNYNFDLHVEASRQRDNIGVNDLDPSDQLKQLTVTKEALVSKENIADDIIGDEEWTAVNPDGTDGPNDKEKLVLSEECQLITMVNVYQGRLEVTTTHVYFFDCSTNKEEGGEDFKWALSQLREIHFRRYNLRRSALELFLIDQTNYFLNFQKKVRNKVYSRILSLRPPNLIYFGSRSPAELLKSSGLSQKWVHREITNFEYLMQLNTIAGRTYNDLSQYPVFPWIISDYESDTLNLNSCTVYRDLSKPIGAVNPKNEEILREKFETFEDPSGVIEKFHYGTHYSNAAGVMHYLLRMEPFTALHIELQGDRFDVTDRQFHSVPGTYKMLMENPNDVKELIPEFFYLPEFLVNENGFDLGKLQITREQVNDVKLPKWAESPEDFVHKNMLALESEYVSENLQNWIDLIFGYKQKGPAAAEALNVFYYCTYEGAVDLDAITNEHDRKALEGMINNFGQTPTQLMKEPHPRRMTLDEIVARSIKIDRPLSIFQFINNLKVYFVTITQDTDPLAYVTVPRSQARSIIQHGMPDSMVTVSEDGKIGMHGWLPYDKTISNYFLFEKDPSITTNKCKRRLNVPFAPGVKVEPKLFVVSHDAKLLISGGHWDNSLQVYHLGKVKKINHIVRHIDIVTCVALDYCGSHLVTGSRDTTCIIWQIQQQGGFSVNINNRPLQTLYGHEGEVTAVYISTELDMVASASRDGTVILHTVRRGHYMKTLHPPCAMGYTLHIPLLAVDEMGRIILYCHETFPIDPKERFSLHLYSINGKHLFTEKLMYGLCHMIIKGDHVITGDIQGHLTIKEIFGLRTVNMFPLHVPIHCLSVTNSNSHILAGIRDGKLIIIGVKNRTDAR
ncbi:neurobeachin-like protein 1 isoform X3 [Mytilus galloprovincialis]|uniref:neurobeachin-like protein 1 isoform X2 n=1 Tax=Mytilus galloprovincialis TaxID=29158 RepID=UPI003F7C6C2A